MMQDEDQDLEDEEDEPMFVLTDEWRDFFAKSEAKRRLGDDYTPSLLAVLLALEVIS